MNFISYYGSGRGRSTFQFKFTSAAWSPLNFFPETWPIFNLALCSKSGPSLTRPSLFRVSPKLFNMLSFPPEPNLPLKFFSIYGFHILITVYSLFQIYHVLAQLHIFVHVHPAIENDLFSYLFWLFSQVYFQCFFF